MSQIIPTPKQLQFLDWEMGLFFHFGIRTFYEGHNDWDGKPMALSAFNPVGLDCDGWIRAARDFGAKYAILVCKHHDGFANWPSKYTDYSVAGTPFRDGNSDVVREFTDACRRYGVKVGLYYSPAEAGFTKRTAREYDDYFINQISELLTGYGVIDYLWFDGCGSEGHTYDTARIISAIRSMQPDILIFNMWDPDTRWVGNEAGMAGIHNRSEVSALDFSVLTDRKDDMGQARFMPAECDFRMRDWNWFYSDKDVHTVKSVDELMGLYYYSVGCGANLLLNIGPDRDGKLPQADADRLAEFGAEIRRRFDNPIASTLEAKDGGYKIALGGNKMINHLVLCEDLTEGERIHEFKVSVRSSALHNPVCICEGHAVGHKRILQFPTVRASELHIDITAGEGGYILKSATVYNV